jgi:tetratricopeptide (TPR) repeat protein
MKKLVGVLFVLVCLASISGCRTSKQGYVAKGNKFFEGGKYAEAALNYGKAIQKDQNYGEAYYRLGLADLKDKKFSPALDAFYRAVELLPNDVNAKEQLGGLALEYYMVDPHRSQRFYALVQQTSDQLLQKNPKSFEGLREKAYLAMTDGKQEEAIALFRKAMDVNPSDAVVTAVLVQNLLQAGKGAEGEKLALNLIARQKDYGHIYNVLYEWYLKQNRTADAENILKAKVANTPKNATSWLELAAEYAHEQKTKEMQATLQHLLDDPHDFPQGRLWVGDFYFRIRNYPEAIRYFEDGARNSKSDEKTLYEKRASQALLAAGKPDQASSAISQVVQENPKDKGARRAQAEILLHSGDPQKIEQAERELLDLATLLPNDPSIWFELGNAEELKGNLDQARARYLESLKRNANYLQARYALAKLGLTQKRPDDTLQQANEILKVRPNDPQARFLRAQALARTGNAASARTEFGRIQDFEHNSQAQLELGLLALSEKKYQEAEQIFSKLAAAGDPQAVAGLAQVYASQKHFDKALEVLGAGLKKSANSTLLLEQHGAIAAVAGQYEAATADFRKLISLEPNSAAARLKLAETLALKGDDHGALELYAEAAKMAPADLNAGLAFANALSRAHQVNQARTQFEGVLKQHPDDPLALNDMAYFLSESGGNLDQALGFAQRALQRVPEQPSFSDTVGCIYLKKGLNDSAIQIFGNLVKKYPNYTIFRYHLGMALLGKGDKKGARKELETALASHPSRQNEARIRELLGKIS